MQLSSFWCYVDRYLPFQWTWGSLCHQPINWSGFILWVLTVLQRTKISCSWRCQCLQVEIQELKDREIFFVLAWAELCLLPWSESRNNLHFLPVKRRGKNCPDCSLLNCHTMSYLACDFNRHIFSSWKFYSGRFDVFISLFTITPYLVAKQDNQAVCRLITIEVSNSLPEPALHVCSVVWQFAMNTKLLEITTAVTSMDSENTKFASLFCRAFLGECCKLLCLQSSYLWKLHCSQTFCRMWAVSSTREFH